MCFHTLQVFRIVCNESSQKTAAEISILRSQSFLLEVNVPSHLNKPGENLK